MFTPSPVLLAARYNKHQIRMLRKMREFAKHQQEQRQAKRRRTHPAPEAKWHHSASWKILVSQIQLENASKQQATTTTTTNKL